MTVLIYNLNDSDDTKLKLLCRKLNMSSRTVEKDEYGCKLGYLLGLTDDSSKGDGSDFDGAMLYLSGLGGMLNIFLDQLRRSKIIVPLKAVQTDTNIGFTSSELYRELCAEREAVANGMKAH